MARIGQPTPEQEAGWREWVAKRPEVVRKVAERFDPWSLYRMKSTGQRVTVVGIFEDGTLRVSVSGQYNAVMFERTVFGIDPDDLEPCELPTSDEPVSAMLSDDEADANIDAIRVAIRPDLFVMGPDGKAVRKN